MRRMLYKCCLKGRIIELLLSISLIGIVPDHIAFTLFTYRLEARFKAVRK
jgi:hypothetical protein